MSLAHQLPRESRNRHRAVWPVEKLAGTPWLYATGNKLAVSPFGARGSKPMTYEERQTADRVVAHITAAGKLAGDLYWVHPATGRLDEIRGAGGSWPALWARGKVWLRLEPPLSTP